MARRVEDPGRRFFWGVGLKAQPYDIVMAFREDHSYHEFD